MKKTILVAGFALAALSGAAQEPTASARAAYQQQQALAEVPRLVQQFDLLVQNQDAIAARLVKLEGTDATGDVRAEIAALRAEVADLKAAIRREQDAMRAEIVKDLAGRIARMAPPPAPAPQAAAAPRAASARRAAQPPPPQPALGAHYEYVVEKGQTLTLIAQGFGTTVPKILAANPGLKPSMLRVGQKIIVPAEEPAASAPKGRKGRK